MQTCHIGLTERRIYTSDFIYLKAHWKSFTYSTVADSVAFIGVCVSAVVNLYCVAKGLVGLLLGAMFVCTIIWYRTQYMNYIILGITEFMLVGVLAAGAFVLALVSEVRDCVGRFIIGG